MYSSVPTGTIQDCVRFRTKSGADMRAISHIVTDTDNLRAWPLLLPRHLSNMRDLMAEELRQRPASRPNWRAGASCGPRMMHHYPVSDILGEPMQFDRLKRR